MLHQEPLDALVHELHHVVVEHVNVQRCPEALGEPAPF